MKKFLTVLSAVFFALTLSSCNNAKLENDVSLKYELNEDRSGYIVTGVNDAKATEVVIPDEYEGLPVVEIKSAAFMNINSVKKAVVGNNVKKIGSDAFKNIDQLESVSLGGGVEHIGDEAFSGCGKLTDVVLGGSLTFFGKNVFKGCAKLKYNFYRDAYYLGTSDNPYLVLTSSADKGSEHFFAHEDCKFIANDAFGGSRSLITVEVGNNVVSIGDNAFDSCVNLKTVVIGDGVTDIGNYAFDNCYNLTDVTIGNAVKSVGTCAFGDFRNGVYTKLKFNAFDNALYLGNSENPYLLLYKANSCDGLTFDKIKNCVINENCKIIYSYAFSSCENLAEIVIPDGVVCIGDSAFSYCKSLKSIVVPKNVTEIGFETFADCTSLKSVKLGEGVKNIGGYAFAKCTALPLITIHKNIEYIDYHAFEKCYKLVEIVNNSDLNIVVGEDLVNGGIGKYALTVHGGESDMDVVGNTYIFLTVDGKNYLVDAVDKAETYNLPENYNGKPYSVCDYAFYGCSSIVSVTLSEGVKSVGNEAFSNCTELTKVEINGETVIGNAAFKNGGKLTEVYLSDKIKDIGSFAFMNSAVETITFGGTCDEWNAVNKMSAWRDGSKIKTVKCTDGDIDLA